MIFLALAMMVQSAAEPSAVPDCENATTQAAMNACSYAEYQAADAALNAQWKIARDVAKSRDLFGELLRAQRRWLAFRDAHCEAVAARYAGGSIRPLIHNGCLTELTETRNAQLREMSETN
ncbi:lysozyme inhibitor LprI family protein [Croceicoccus hydrothermalis]|uniref:lysozyme inhibitor LprI family protein n=1 Tax=Croceicoccus hydrothermalis TaxID=2867964 RepID=UPI001EFBDD53|nr:lysozyme inhibitor LprI family protein [Croceicoccus hydrothermalis]